MLSNLLNNAVESIDGAGVVTVRLKTIQKQAVLGVVDKGKGMPELVLKQIGNRGFTFGKSKGSGLDFSYVQSKVASWGGKLRVNSQLRKGTTIRIQLPISQEI